MFLFRALASGSSGNAYLLRTDKVSLLFDAGLRLPRLEQYLHAEGVAPGSLTAILISHEHRDHCAGAADLATEYDVPVCANEEALRAAGLVGLKQAHMIEVGRPVLYGDVEVTCFPVEHDAVRPVGFSIRAAGRSIAIATDLGRATDEVGEVVASADLVVLEANHDSEMLIQGRYPYHLRRRVAGPTGHLSNTQAAGVLLHHLKDEYAEVWLAHLSKENNTPAIALRTVRSYLKSAGLGALSIGIAHRDRPSLRWTGEPRPRQLSLFSAFDAGTP